MIPTATLPHVVRIEDALGSGSEGETWADPTGPIPARVSAGMARTADASGQDVNATASIELRPREVAAGSIVTHGPDRYTVIGVEHTTELRRRYSTILRVGPA